MKTQLIRKAAPVAGAPLSTTPDKAVRRLDNIQTREVSLVDNAANGRQFLIVKRAGAQKEADKNILKGQDDTSQPTSATPAAPAAQSEELLPIVKGDFSKLSEKILEKVPVAKTLAWPQKDMFFAMADALSSFCMGMDMITADIMSFANSDGKTGFMGVEVVKAAIKKENPDMPEAELVEKAGKKMKKDRWMKLKKMQDELAALVNELADENENETDVTKGGTMNTKTENTQGQPAAPAAAAPAAQPTAPVAKEAPAASEAPAAQPAPAAAAPVAQAQGVTAEQVAEIVTKSVKAAVEPLQKEIETLKNAPAAPAGEGADGTEDVTKSANGGGQAPASKKESIFKGVL